MAHRTCKTLLALGILSALCLYSSAAKAQLSFYLDFAKLSAVSPTVLIDDFESFSPKGTSLPSIAGNGVTFVGLGGAPFPNVFVTGPGYTNYGVKKTTSSILTANGDEDYRIDFDMPQLTVGFDTYVNSFGPVTIQVFGVAGLLGSYSLIQDPTIVGFFGIVSSEPISAVRWTSVNGRITNTGIDNVRIGLINSFSAPEPGALILPLAGAVAGAGLLRRRRKLA